VIEEWEFFYGLAQAMKLPLTIYAGYSWGPEIAAPAATQLDMDQPPTTDELLEALTKGSRVSLDEVKEHPHGHVFDEPESIVQPKDPDCTAHFDFANEVMLGELDEVAAEDVAREGDFAYRLVSRRLLDVHNSAGRDIPKLVRKYRYNPAFMHPEDLEALGVASGEVVEIESDHATILGVAESESGLRRGVVSMPHALGMRPPRKTMPGYGASVATPGA